LCRSRASCPSAWTAPGFPKIPGSCAALVALISPQSRRKSVFELNSKLSTLNPKRHDQHKSSRRPGSRRSSLRPCRSSRGLSLLVRISSPHNKFQKKTPFWTPLHVMPYHECGTPGLVFRCSRFAKRYSTVCAWTGEGIITRIVYALGWVRESLLKSECLARRGNHDGLPSLEAAGCQFHNSLLGHDARPPPLRILT
jgi:hypothetical protein